MNVGVLFKDLVDQHGIKHAELEHHDASKHLEVAISDVLEGKDVGVVVHVDQLQDLHGNKAPSSELDVNTVAHDYKNEDQHDTGKPHLVNC